MSDINSFTKVVHLTFSSNRIGDILLATVSYPVYHITRDNHRGDPYLRDREPFYPVLVRSGPEGDAQSTPTPHDLAGSTPTPTPKTLKKRPRPRPRPRQKSRPRPDPDPTARGVDPDPDPNPTDQVNPTSQVKSSVLALALRTKNTRSRFTSDPGTSIMTTCALISSIYQYKLLF